MEKLVPLFRDLPYGPHPRNTLDFYRPDADGPVPLLVWIHGGGFWCGNKGTEETEIMHHVRAGGIAVAYINYRLSQQAPFPAPFVDCARAIQFCRYKADRLKIDPSRIAAGGSSAGGGMSLWIGFHDDLADPNSEDPIARESSRLSCMVCWDTQSSYDPNYIATILNRRAAEHQALQALFRVEPADFQTPQAKKIFAEGSPIEYVTADAPPVFMLYSRRNIPITEELDADYAIHHPIFGEVLRERLAEHGVECELQTRDDHPGCKDEQIPDIFVRQAVTFLRRQFGL